jgi:hypothetical protein
MNKQNTHDRKYLTAQGDSYRLFLLDLCTQKYSDGERKA